MTLQGKRRTEYTAAAGTGRGKAPFFPVHDALVMLQRGPVLEPFAALGAGVEGRRNAGHPGAVVPFGRRQNAVPCLQMHAQFIPVGHLETAHVAHVAHALVLVGLTVASLLIA